MRRPAVALAVTVVAAGGAATAATLGLGGGPASGPDTGALPPATATVTRQTLHDTYTADGELGYGPATAVVNRLPGTITALPDTGDRITRGTTLYEVDETPVTLMYGTTPAYRTLRPGMEGADVRQLERNLKALGYTGFTVDDTYTWDTAEAVMRWQDDRGLPSTGTVELGRVVFAPGAIRVQALHVDLGDPATPGRRVLSRTGTGKAVTVRLPATEQQLAKRGAKVTVTLPDDTVVDGRVSEVTTVVEPGENPVTWVEVVVELRGEKAREAAAGYVSAAVDVTFTAGRRENVLTVPVAALLALREGGFGVEVVRGSATEYVPVTTGLFADGWVEISGVGIGEGTTVGMPG